MAMYLRNTPDLAKKFIQDSVLNQDLNCEKTFQTHTIKVTKLMNRRYLIIVLENAALELKISNIYLYYLKNTSNISLESMILFSFCIFIQIYFVYFKKASFVNKNDKIKRIVQGNQERIINQTNGTYFNSNYVIKLQISQIVEFQLTNTILNYISIDGKILLIQKFELFL